MQFYSIPAETRAKIMGQLALAWDGQWFLKTVDEFGLDNALKMNARVRKSFGKIEMKAMLKVLDKKTAANIDDALKIILTYCNTFLNLNFNAQVEQQNNGSLDISITNCPVLENCRRANLPRFDQACLACTKLWPAWFSVLLPRENMKINVLEQMGRGNSRCLFRINQD